MTGRLPGRHATGHNTRGLTSRGATSRASNAPVTAIAPAHPPAAGAAYYSAALQPPHDSSE